MTIRRLEWSISDLERISRCLLERPIIWLEEENNKFFKWPHDKGVNWISKPEHLFHIDFYLLNFG